MNFTFAELDAILAMIEMHDWCMLSEHLDVDVSLLYDKVSELRDEVAWNWRSNTSFLIVPVMMKIGRIMMLSKRQILLRLVMLILFGM